MIPSGIPVKVSYVGAGCLNDAAVVVTEYGMCFADQNNIYLHDGNNPKVISQSIARGSRDPYTDGSGGWQDNNKTNVQVTFDGKRKSFLIFFSYSYNNTVYNRCWAYNLLYKRWDLLSSPGKVKNTFIDANGGIFITADVSGVDTAFNYLGGSLLKPWSWVSKDLIMGNATQDKKLKTVRINSNESITDENLTLSINNGTSVEYTGEEDLANGLFHKVIKPVISTDNKSLRIALSAINGTTEVDSIGVIYRAKRIK